MDISGYKIDENGSVLKVTHPETKEETGIEITCLSPEHRLYKNKVLEVKRKWIVDGKLDVPQMEASKHEILAAMIVDWKNIELEGKEFKYTPGNAISLMESFPWIADQVNEFCGVRENFFTKSKKA